MKAPKTKLPQKPFTYPRQAVNTDQPMIRNGVNANSNGVAVRLATFGVRANGIRRPVIACWIDLNTPARLTGNRIRLKP